MTILFGVASIFVIVLVAVKAHYTYSLSHSKWDYLWNLLFAVILLALMYAIQMGLL